MAKQMDALASMARKFMADANWRGALRLAADVRRTVSLLTHSLFSIGIATLYRLTASRQATESPSTPEASQLHAVVLQCITDNGQSMAKALPTKVRCISIAIGIHIMSMVHER